MFPEPTNPDDYPDKRELRAFEGGAVYLAERDGEFLVITDESTMWGLLDEEDLKGLSPCTVRRFDTESDRMAYIVERRWMS